MIFGLREKLFVFVLGLVLAIAVAVEVFLTPSVASHLTNVAVEDWDARARLMAQVASASTAELSESPTWTALAGAMGRDTGARIAFVRGDGMVLGDSDLPAEELRYAENEANRPDFRAASQSPGARSLTVNERTRELSLAVPMVRDARVAGILRITAPLGDIDEFVGGVRRNVWTGAVVVLLLGWTISGLLAKRLVFLVNELTSATRRMSEGDFAVKTHLPGSDEFAQLGQTLDRLADGLATTFGELRGERDLQKKILEAMHEGVIVVDRDGKIALVNSALRAMLLLGADAVGKLLIETVRHAQLNALIARARSSPDARLVEIELPGLKPRRVLVQVAPLSAGDEGFVFVFVDVTELRRLESLRRDFVANASHELRTPIAAVRSATETLRSGALEDRVAASRFVDIIERNAQRLQSLVEDMLELSKLESNEFKLKRERVELQRVVPIVLALFRERAEKKGVALSAEIPAALPSVEGDPRALEHVLSNLVDNAVKYCPAGTRIVVGATADEQRVRLVVSDTVHGIAPEHLPRVFERFYRIDAGRSRDLGGTGLGLSIVKHMVEAMRGKVSVESAIGKGSTFFVLLNRGDTAAGGLGSGSASRPRIAVGSDGVA